MKRSTEDILIAPKYEDTVAGKLLGYRHNCKYIWLPCPTCGMYRWIQNTNQDRKRKGCRNCARSWVNRGKGHHICPDMRRYKPDVDGEYRTILSSDIPKEGDLIRGGEIGHSDLSIYKWTYCSRCGQYRWVRKNTRGSSMCHACGNEYKKEKYIGTKSSQWKGGRIVTRQGYIHVILREDNPYYAMVNNMGYVAEHRLVMAQLLGRCLKRWEIVHHKHTRFPAGSKEDKQDNRPENLELYPSRYDHNSITTLEKQISELKQQVVVLETKVKLCEWRIKELEGVSSYSNKEGVTNGQTCEQIKEQSK